MSLSAAALAARHFRKFPLSKPDRQELEERWQERSYAHFEFTAPLDARLLERSYFVLHEKGIDVLELTRLSGEVRYARFEAEPKPEFSVEVCGKTARTIKEAGFVAITPKSTFLDWSVEPLVVQADYGTQIGKRRMLIPPTEFSPVRSALSFIDPIDATRYVLVRRKPDRSCQWACCEVTYDLYRVSRNLVAQGSSSYQCDL